MELIANLNGVKKVVNNRIILNDLNLKIFKGDFISIVGESGAGKTTLLGIIALLDREFEGEYILDEKNITCYSDSEIATARNKKIGFIMQDFSLIENYTVYQNIYIPIIYSKDKKDKKKIKERIENLIDEFGLNGKENQIVSTLSGGERQRVAIIRAIINDPEIVIADEPTSALDSEKSLYICNVLKQLNQKGKTVIVVTHNEQEVLVSNKKYILKDNCLRIQDEGIIK